MAFDDTEIDHIRRRVANVIGHELRTPVSTIQGLVRVLEADPAGPDRDEALASLRRVADRTADLVDDLLVAAGLWTALPVDPPAKVDVSAALADAVAAVDAKVSIDVDDAGGVTAWARAGSVARCVHELVDNAVRYCTGDVVTIRVRDVDHVVSVEISAPTSLAERDVAYVFEAFYRGEAAVSTAPGIGLGLTVAQALARHDGGDVHLLLADGSATTTLQLPSSLPMGTK